MKRLPFLRSLLASLVVLPNIVRSGHLDTQESVLNAERIADKRPSPIPYKIDSICIRYNGEIYWLKWEDWQAQQRHRTKLAQYGDVQTIAWEGGKLDDYLPKASQTKFRVVTQKHKENLVELRDEKGRIWWEKSNLNRLNL